MSSHDTLKPKLFGKITASVTHEMQNVLAIIKENAGLMEDLINLTSREDSEILLQRLSGCLTTIKNQVTRGVGLAFNLNGFAHTADHSQQTVDIIKITERLLTLTERISRNAGIETLLEPHDTPLRMETDPIQFQVCLHLSLECLLLTAPLHSVISFAFKKDNNSVSVVEIKTTHPDTPIPDMTQTIPVAAPWNELIQAVQPINAQVEPTASGIVLSFD